MQPDRQAIESLRISAYVRGTVGRKRANGRYTKVTV